MPVDWYQVADMAVRGVGGVLFITFAYLLFRALKKCASEMFGAVRGHATGNGTGSGDPNETTTTKAADHTAYQGRAVKAAQQIVAEACDRSIVRPEHAQFYDFVLMRPARCSITRQLPKASERKCRRTLGRSHPRPPVLSRVRAVAPRSLGLMWGLLCFEWRLLCFSSPPLSQWCSA